MRPHTSGPDQAAAPGDEGGAVLSDFTRLERAVELALHAPSVHNTQPWRWQIRPDRVELYADRERQLAGTDPDGRDLLLSCGAALHHLRVAAAGLGLATTTRRLPDPGDPEHLATLSPVPGPADPAELRLFGQLHRRHTDRRHYSGRPVERPLLEELAAEADRYGAVLFAVTDPRTLRGIHDTIARAMADQPQAAGYLAELVIWTHRYADAQDGIPTTAVPTAPGFRPADAHLRRFGSGRLPEAPGATDEPTGGGMLMVLATPADDEASRLAAGEALSAVLLTATLAGLATAPLSNAIEVPSARDRLRREVLRITEEPQLVLRIGHPVAGAPPLAATPRRPLEDVLR